MLDLTFKHFALPPFSMFLLFLCFLSNKGFLDEYVAGDAQESQTEWPLWPCHTATTTKAGVTKLAKKGQ